MSDRIKALVIVEGEKAEPAFCRSMEAAYSLDFEIYVLGTNIYTLYKKLKEYDFDADIKQVLAELHPDRADVLSQKFAYTYLFFDMDPHHARREETRALPDIIMDNIWKIREMAAFFTDETDPTVGKLYINYPMLESYRDCDVPFDCNYQNEYVALEDIADFKQYVARKQMVRKHLDKYTDEDFNQLTRMNVYKLNLLTSGVWEALSYPDYQENSDPLLILDRQSGVIQDKKKLAILNTSLFLLLDYFGNQTGFFDHVVQGG